MVRIHSPRPTFSNTYRHFDTVIRVQTGSTVDPILTRVTDSVGRCRRVLIDLPFGDVEDLLGAYQEVWQRSRMRAAWIETGRLVRSPHFETVTSTVFDLIRAALSGSG